MQNTKERIFRVQNKPEQTENMRSEGHLRSPLCVRAWHGLELQALVFSCCCRISWCLLVAPSGTEISGQVLHPEDISLSALGRCRVMPHAFGLLGEGSEEEENGLVLVGPPPQLTHPCQRRQLVGPEVWEVGQPEPPSCSGAGRAGSCCGSSEGWKPGGELLGPVDVVNGQSRNPVCSGRTLETGTVFPLAQRLFSCKNVLLFVLQGHIL